MAVEEEPRGESEHLGESLSSTLFCTTEKTGSSHHKRSTDLMLSWSSAPNYDSGSCLCGFMSKYEKTA